MKKINAIGIVFILSFIFSGLSLADMSSDYQNANLYIQSNQETNSISHSVLNIKNQITTIPTDPKSSAYLNHPESMPNDAANMVNQNADLNSIQKNILERPHIQINSQSDEMKDSRLVEQNATSIAEGTYKDCNKKIFHQPSSVTQTCQTPNTLDFTCEKTLSVKLTTPWTPVTCDTVLRIDDGNNPPAGSVLLNSFVWKKRFGGFFYRKRTVSFYAVPTEDKNANCLFPGSFYSVQGATKGSYSLTLSPMVSANIYAVLVNPDNTGGANVSVSDASHSLFHFNASASLNSQAFQNSDQSNNETVNIDIQNSGTSPSSSPLIAVTYITVPYQPNPVIETQWVNSCEDKNDFLSSGFCHVGSTKCEDENSTKVIDGINVTEPCWQEALSYHCDGEGDNTCLALENEGCQSIGASCAASINGICLRFNETMSCSSETEVGEGLQCGERFFCMDGNCQTISSEKNTQFGQSITELNAVSSAAGDVENQGTNPNVNPSSISIFQGQVAQCRDISLGIMNCCNDTGWAKGVFTNCSDEEKNLGLAKEKGGLVVYVGRYCSDHFLGFCTAHKEGYCIFPSRIAYDVQVGGRRDQLGRGFGDPHYPDCSGITPDDLKRIQFSRIDFSNAISNVEAQGSFPQEGDSEAEIEQKIQQMMNGNNDHD